MKKLCLLSLLILFSTNLIVFGAEEKVEQSKEKLETKTLQVEAVTTATPKPKEEQVVITGTIICTSCDLKDQKNAKSQCSVYGCSYAIKVKNARTFKGQLVKEYVGKIYQILANDNSAALLQKEYKGKDVIIVSKVYSDENVVEVDFVKLASKKEEHKH